MSARPLCTYEGEDTGRLFNAICPEWSPPSYWKIANTLLNETYECEWANVKKVLDHELHLNFVIDESTDIASNRIINISIVTTLGVFYWETENSGSESQTAEMLTKWLLVRVETLIDSNWTRFNSLSTDTCATMRAVWDLLSKDPRTSHVFCIPCDSHGLQLLIKDLFEIEPYSIILANAQLIVTTFRKAKLQLQILRKYQEQLYGKRKIFCMSVITRWGTQAGMMESVIENKRALKEYIKDPEAEIAPDVKSIITKSEFWAALEDIFTLIDGISGPQKRSEATHAHVGLVHQRWNDIHLHIEETIKLSAFRTTPIGCKKILPAFFKRRAIQNQPLHTIAYYLNPQNISAAKVPSFTDNKMVLDFIKQNTEGMGVARRQFASFRSKEGYFSTDSPAWELYCDPLGFWEEMKIFAPELASLCIRVFNTPANSVPSERSFSTRNLIHSKLRSNLTCERANKLTFIHVNGRILDRHVSEVRGYYNLDEQELLKIEQLALEKNPEEDLQPDWVGPGPR